MKVLVGARSPIVEWFRESDDSQTIKLVLKLLNSTAVLGLTKHQSKWLFQPIPNNWREKQLQDSVNQKVHVWARVPMPEDCEIYQKNGFSWADLLVSDDFETLEHKRTIPNTSKQTREETFDRFFSHLLPFAKKLEYVDSYFFDKFELDSGPMFFMERVLRSGTELVIHTKAAHHLGDRNRAFVNSLIKQIQGSIINPPKVEVNVYSDSISNFPHDRMGRVVFEKGQVAFQIGYGEQIFAKKSTMKIGTIGTVAIDYDELEIFLDKLKPTFTLPMRN